MISGDSENLGKAEAAPHSRAFKGSCPTTTHDDATSISVVRRSTGPRTTQGKARSNQNALKHGIFGKVVVLKGESRAEFVALLSGLREDFMPVGTLENVLVETLAVTLWRQRRLLIAEAAEIEGGREIVEPHENRVDLAQAIEAARSRRHRVEGAIQKIGEPEVLQMCLDILRNLKVRIKGNVFNPENDKHILSKIYGDSSAGFRINKLFDDSLIANSDERPVISPEDSKREFLNELENEIERLRRYPEEQALIESNRIKQMNLESRRRSVPDSQRLDQLLRYSASLERTFDRTLHQLERTQRMRRGQPVAPQIDVNVSSS